MTAAADLSPVGGKGLRARLLRFVARPEVQARAARWPLVRRLVRHEGAAMFDIVQGFVASQVLRALVELEVIERLLDGPLQAEEIPGLPPDRMARLLQAGAALGLLRQERDGRFAASLRGAALTGVPGLAAMIRHHDVLYRDLADPVAFLSDRTDPELARFWPYVLGAGAEVDPAQARLYSGLMRDSQALVAEDTLATIPLRGVRHLLDIGGGTGAFAEAAARARPGMRVTLLDLPPVASAARDRLAGTGIVVADGSFRTDPLPEGADAAALIRVLYDHDDDTVRALLAKVYAALPPDGLLIVSEPMSGGTRPEPAGDVYFALYTMAMGSGRVRSQARIADLCRRAGFETIRCPRPARPFVTSVVTARKSR